MRTFRTCGMQRDAGIAWRRIIGRHKHGWNLGRSKTTCLSYWFYCFGNCREMLFRIVLNFVRWVRCPYAWEDLTSHVRIFNITNYFFMLPKQRVCKISINYIMHCKYKSVLFKTPEVFIWNSCLKHWRKRFTCDTITTHLFFVFLPHSVSSSLPHGVSTRYWHTKTTTDWNASQIEWHWNMKLCLLKLEEL